MIKAPILIVGAGPTGLALALELTYHDVPFKIIDKAKGPGETSRAMLVVPKVLESYEKFGLAQKVTQEGIIPEYAHFHSNNKRIASLPLGVMGKGQSRYSDLVTFPQDEHEQLLLEKLNDFGRAVEWKTELVSLEQVGVQSEVTMKTDGGSKTETFDYVIGCDGASSQVRVNRAASTLKERRMNRSFMCWMQKWRGGSPLMTQVVFPSSKIISPCSFL
ncbi:MAG: FAD-dependent monooxygenase [Alkalibacterium sp.]|nr:FAD-dependent monooxygenase [Alkalibacterium sp.]